MNERGGRSDREDAGGGGKRERRKNERGIPHAVQSETEQLTAQA